MNPYEAASRGGYPASPGYKARDTAADAAHAVKPKAATVRAAILALLAGRFPELWPEQAAATLALDILTVRPRFSELAAAGLIEDTGERAPSRGGRKAIIWRMRNGRR